MLASPKRCSDFHTKLGRIDGIIIHRYTLPNVLMWAKFEMGATEGDDLAGLRIEPLRCYHPPTTQVPRFNLYLCDGGNNVLAESAGFSPPEERGETGDKYDENENECDNKDNHLSVHVLLFPLFWLISEI